MKLETMIYDRVKRIIPKKSEKTIFFAGITETSHEVYFYAFIDGSAVQCYTLAERYELDENELSKVFEEVVDDIKASELYILDKYNVVTIIVDQSEVTVNVEHYDMGASEYRIQKEWKTTYIS